jgi:hypothetical protein
MMRIAQTVAVLSCSAEASSSERSLLSARAVTKSCEEDYSDLKIGDECATTWSKLTRGSVHKLRPTEPSVGHSYAVYQMNDDFYSMEKATKWLGKKKFPVVLYDNDYYLTDRHHHALALELTGDANMWEIPMTVEVVDDYRGGSGDFWSAMESNGYAFLYSVDDSNYDSLFERIDTATMPRDWNLTSYTDNIWRSFAGFTTHIDDESQRCYFKDCMWFLDFAWGHMFASVTYHDQAVWPDNGHVAFRSEAETLPRRPTVDQVNLDRWFQVSNMLLPLCHSDSVKDYPLPEGFPSKTLAGWSTVPVPDDPDCVSSETVV